MGSYPNFTPGQVDYLVVNNDKSVLSLKRLCTTGFKAAILKPLLKKPTLDLGV